MNRINAHPYLTSPKIRHRWTAFVLLLGTAIAGCLRAESPLEVGFSEVDITPSLKKGAVWLAGYTPGRRAKDVHDPLYARCVVVKHNEDRIALVSVDLVGLPRQWVQKVRQKITGFRYVMVSSTHNHEGPDVIGLWGPSFFQRGTNEAYMKMLVDRISSAIKDANNRLGPVAANFGTASDESLLRDSRLPKVKDGVLRVIRFDKQVALESGDKPKPAGIVVQWNCHPEALGSRNKSVTADFPYATVANLKKKYACPIVYFSGAVGGLMAPPRNRIRGDDGVFLRDGNFKYAERYGNEVAALAMKAIDDAKPVSLTNIKVSTQEVAVPVTNSWYRAARALGVVKRPAHVWTGDYSKIGERITPANANQPTAIVTEVGCLRLGEMHMACIPGEIFPELVYGQFQEPAEANADFPDAKLEPHLSKLLPSDKWMLFGLANDEIGYIIPKRQWDSRRPYAYGRNRSQYGEINSCGPEVAAIVMDALRTQVEKLK